MPSILYSHITWRRPQIKVRDLSRASVTITPAEFASWADARAELLTEAKRPLKAQFEAEMAGAANESETRQIRAAFDQREKAIEHEIDHKPLEMHLSLGVSYVSTTPQPLPSHSRRPTYTHNLTCNCCAFAEFSDQMSGTSLEDKIGLATSAIVAPPLSLVGLCTG
jgi:hypothetical protein